MTPEKVVLLNKLLQEAIDDGRILPDGSWELVQQLTSWTAPELVIVSDDFRKVLLHFRKDDPRNEETKILRPEYIGKWRGWLGQHFCGGYMRPMETFQNSCDRMAKEVGISGGVEMLGVTFVRKWLDHPYSFPVSIGVVCKATGPVTETDNVRFFGAEEIPSIEEFIHPSHYEFLMTYFLRLSDYYHSDRSFWPFIPILENQHSDWLHKEKTVCVDCKGAA